MRYYHTTLLLFLFSILPVVSADQDYSKWHVPEGAIARLGKGTITDIAYAPDGSRLYVLSSIGIWIYDAQTGAALDLISDYHYHNVGMTFSPDGKVLVCVGGNTIRIWDVSTNTLIRTLKGNISLENDGQSVVYDVSFNPDGKVLASCGRIGKHATVRLWDITTGKVRKTLKHSHATRKNEHVSIMSVAFSPDGKLLASGSRDNTVRLWNARTGRHRHTLLGHAGYGVSSVAFSPVGKLLASGADGDKTVRLWDVTTSTLIKTFEGHNVRSVTFSPDGKSLATGGDDTTVRLWEISTGHRLPTLEGHINDVKHVAFAPDGKTLASASKIAVRLWDIDTANTQKILEGHTSRIESIALSPDGKIIAAGYGYFASTVPRNLIRLWDVNTRTYKLLENIGDVYSVAFSPNGQQLASGGLASEIDLWDVNTGKRLRVFSGPDQSVTNSVAFSPDGQTLAAGNRDTTVRLWDVNTSTILHTFKRQSASISSVAFSPDGKILASGSKDKTICLWDAHAGRHLRTLTSDGYSVNCVAFSPDGKILASVSPKLIHLWNVDTGQAWHRLDRKHLGHKAWLNYATFSPDGKTLATDSPAGIQLWDVNTGKPLYTLGGHAISIAFSNNGHQLVSGGHDGTILLWDLSTKR